MRKFMFIVSLLFAANTWAIGEVVLVSSVKGAVTIEGSGSAKEALQPFVRLKTGDRLSVPANAQVSLVYFNKGRQEIWPGNAVLVVGESESQKVSGNAQAQFKQLPSQVTQQINRSTPAPDGKVGMVRLRTYFDVDKFYRELRANAVASDIEPELYLLAGLFAQGQYTRMESEMERISNAFPEDNSLKTLRKLYTRAIADARQSENKTE